MQPARRTEVRRIPNGPNAGGSFMQDQRLPPLTQRARSVRVDTLVRPALARGVRTDAVGTAGQRRARFQPADLALPVGHSALCLGQRRPARAIPQPPASPGGTRGLAAGFDVAELSALLFLTGGLENPFAFLFTCPVLIAATILPARVTAMLAGFAVGVRHIPDVLPLSAALVRRDPAAVADPVHDRACGSRSRWRSPTPASTRGR